MSAALSVASGRSRWLLRGKTAASGAGLWRQCSSVERKPRVSACLKTLFTCAHWRSTRSLGFTVKEPVAVITGSPRGGDASDHAVRPLQDEDLDACGELRRAVDGHECTSELRDAKQAFSVDHSRCDALAGAVGACRAPRCEAVDGPPARWCVLTSVAHADTAAYRMGRGRTHPRPSRPSPPQHGLKVE